MFWHTENSKAMIHERLSAAIYKPEKFDVLSTVIFNDRLSSD